MTRWPCNSTCQASKALAMAESYSRNRPGRRTGVSSSRFGVIAVPLARGGKHRLGGRVQAGAPRDDVRGDGGAPGHRHPPGPPGPGKPAPPGARTRGPAEDLALDTASGPDDPRPERAPGLDPRTAWRHVRGRAPAAGREGGQAPG